jgi:amino acid adenylation domain-containing protein
MSDILKQITELSPQQRDVLLRRLKQKNVENTRPKIIPQSKENIPLSFAQQRLWFIDQLAPGTPAYNIPVAIRLTGALNVIALEQSINAVIRRHEALRTTFKTINGQSNQVIAPVLTLKLPIVELSEQELQQTIIQEVKASFDLIQGPLLRIKLLQLSPEEHVFLLVMHHIISDGWSIGVIVRELAALYAAFSQEKPAPLPELPIQYADFAIWQRNWLQGEVLQSQLDYWQQQLGENLPVLELPIDRPRPPVQTFNGRKYSFALSQNLTEALEAISQQQGVTLFMTLLAAFQILLYRYSGQEDICVGSPIANRNYREIEGLIGFFVNTLALRTNLGGNPTFRELLERVRAVTLGAYAHQDLPFEKLVEQLQLERSLSYNPLFQVMFALQNTPMPTLELKELKLHPLEVDSGTAQLDLTLHLEQKTNGIAGVFEYNTDLFDGNSIASMANHFQTLLESIITNLEQPISKLSLLTPAEQQQILVGWNSTQTTYPLEFTLHQLIETQVEKTPDAIAVKFADQQLTYRELNNRANQLAHHLQNLGIKPEVLVGICVERSLEMVIGLLGILKAGGAYVPLEPHLPQERLAFMLADTQVKVLLTQQHLVAELPEHSAQLICLDTDWEIIAQASEKNLEIAVTPENLAYVIYTSGSTGKPKGAMNTHRGICNRLLWMQDVYQLTEADCVLQKTPFGFDVSVWEFFWTLLTGARLVLAKPKGHQDSAYLVQLIVQEKVTTLHFVPSMLQIFLQEQGLSECQSLRQVMCSGEALPYALQERFFAHLNAELHNLYGPTEAAVDVTYWACERDSNSPVVPIGRPIANTQIYLLDSDLQPVPVGVAGELHIGGVGLARGYLNRPDLTAQKFIPNPFSYNPAARLYKTGDLARYRYDGTIEYLGRIDYQVKIRGFRIELGEIEAILGQHPAIQEAVVLVREDHPGEKRLVAYVVTSANSHVSEFRSYLKSKLPDYMMPAAFVMLDSLPLTVNGKVDRRALPLPEIARPDLQVTYIAPTTEVEQTMTTVWQEVLQVEKVGINDNFFDLGGHSLLMVKVQNKLQELLSQELSILELFQYPTINSLANYLSEAKIQASDLVTTELQAQKLEAGKNRRKQRLTQKQKITKNNIGDD